jgi:hypothetical protein
MFLNTLTDGPKTLQGIKPKYVTECQWQTEPVAHACNPNHLGDRDQEDQGLDTWRKAQMTSKCSTSSLCLCGRVCVCVCVCVCAYVCVSTLPTMVSLKEAVEWTSLTHLTLTYFVLYNLVNFTEPQFLHL